MGKELDTKIEGQCPLVWIERRGKRGQAPEKTGANIIKADCRIGRMVVIALVGLPGSGKSIVAGMLEKRGFIRIRFGDTTDAEMKKRGLRPGEESEKLVREDLRKEIGMHAYAFLNLERIRKAKGDVVIDGLRSLEEYEYLKDELPDLVVIAVYAPQDVRYKRMAERAARPRSPEEAKQRDIDEVQNLNVLGPIAHAEYTLVNDGGKEELEERLEKILEEMKK